MASRTLLAAIVLAAPLALAAPAGMAAAAPPDMYGFAYSDNATPPGVYVPDPTRQWVSSGGVATVQPTGPVGAYTVLFPGIASTAGIAHVTAVNRTGIWCQVAAYGASGANERVDVRCFSPNGVPASSQFTVLFSTGPGLASPGQYAHVRATAAGTVATSVNTSGAANSVVPGAVGSYTVTLPNVGIGGSPSGGLQVTSTGGVPGRCKVAGWNTTAVAQSVLVRCVNPGGVPANYGWTLSYQSKRSIVSSITPPGRFAYVFDTLGAVPPNAWWNSGGGGFGLAGAGIGLRQVSFPVVGAPPATMQVTAFGPGPEYCTFASPWMIAGGTVTMQYVVCYLNGGAYSTQRSLVTYTSRF